MAFSPAWGWPPVGYAPLARTPPEATPTLLRFLFRLHRPHQQQRHIRMAEHIIRDAAQEEALQPAAPVGGHRDQLGPLRARRRHDLLGRLPEAFSHLEGHR